MRVRLFLVAALASLIVSAAYQCMSGGPRDAYRICRAVAVVGAPGIIGAAYLGIPFHEGSHAGGPETPVIATVINFAIFLGAGIVGHHVLRLFARWRKGTGSR